MASLVKVALIGAGRTGTPLLKELLKYRYIKLVGVADRKENAAGIKLAAARKIYTTSDPMEMLRKKKSIDILIDVEQFLLECPDVAREALANGAVTGVLLALAFGAEHLDELPATGHKLR